MFFDRKCQGGDHRRAEGLQDGGERKAECVKISAGRKKQPPELPGAAFVWVFSFYLF